MAFAPGFKHDVFVSYAMVDDTPPPDLDDGWVYTFTRNLQQQLARRLGRSDAYSLWMDRANLHPNEDIAPAIIDNIKQSATLVLILSRGYLASEWCAEERNAFLEAVKTRSAGDGSIFVIAIDDTDRSEWPHELQDLLGYRFWSRATDGRIKTFGYPTPNPRLDREYYELVIDLATDIVQTLQRLADSFEASLPAEDEPLVAEDTKGSNLPSEIKNTLHTKLEKGEYDVFLCHNSEDKNEVKVIAKLLMSRGILPWLDEWDLQPGLPWQVALEKQIANIRSAAVFVGGSGFGPWQNMELSAFLRQFVGRNCPVIPVLLSTCEKSPNLPVFLGGLNAVDFRKEVTDPLDRLIWGITGERPNLDARI